MRAVNRTPLSRGFSSFNRLRRHFDIFQPEKFTFHTETMPVKLKRGIQEWNAALRKRSAQIAQQTELHPLDGKLRIFRHAKH
jgi:hypothetical protein